MDHETITTLLEVAGNAGVLWVACVFLVKTLKAQYERRIEVLEGASLRCDQDRSNLHAKIEAILLAELKRTNREKPSLD